MSLFARRPGSLFRRLSMVVGLAVGTVGLSGCEDELPFEVIDEIAFAASLGIDLADFTKLPSGVWIRQDVVGTGAVLAPGNRANLNHFGWLRTGTQFSAGPFSYVYGAVPREVIVGFEYGMEGMAVGDTRTILIPPELGYGTQGAGPVPPGAVLIFEIELTSIG